MAKKETTEKARKRKTGRKATRKVEEVLQDKVHNTVGRGVLAYFAAEDEQPRESEASTADVDAELGAMLDKEVMAAGDALAEVEATRAPTEAHPDRGREASRSPLEASVAEARAPATTAATPETEAEPQPEEAERTPPTTAESAAPTAITSASPETQPGGILMEHPMETSAPPPGPGAETSPEIPRPSPPPASLSREEIIQRIADEHFKEIEDEISRLYDRIPKVLASNKRAADEALIALRDARALLWASPERLVDAEYQVNQVKALVERHRLSEEWGRVYGRRLLLYETGWLVALLAGFVAVQVGQRPLMDWVNALVGPGGDTTYTGVLIPFLNSLIWGGIGGVVGALYSLWWHVSEMQDFDKRYNMWYLVQPIMGVVLGGIVYLIITTGFLVLQGTVPTVESARGIQMFPSLVAVLGGFRQKFVYELLERIIRVLTPTPEG